MALKLTTANTQRALAVVREWTEKLRILGALAEARCSERFREKIVAAVEKAVPEMLGRSVAPTIATSTTSSASTASQSSVQQAEEDAATAGAAWCVLDVVEEHSREAHIVTDVLGSGTTDASTATSATLKAEARRALLLCALTRVADELQTSGGSFKSLAAWAECQRGGLQRLMHLVASRQERVATATRKCAEETRTEQAEAKAEAARQEAEIEELRKRLAEVRAAAAIDGKVLRRELQAHADTQRRVIAERDAEMAAALDTLRRRLQSEDQVAGMMTTHLESRLGRLQQQVNEWMTRFEADTEERTHALEALKAKKERDLVSLYDCRERSREVSEEIEKHKKAVDLQRDIAELERREAAAALAIQTAWRKHKARSQFAEMKRRKAARGKKKKGRGGGAAVRLPRLKK